MNDSESPRARVKRLALEHAAGGQPLAWFEKLYHGALGNEAEVPWAEEPLNPNYVEWAERAGLAGHGRSALVVGCGLGDEAEDLAGRGFAVTAFDIAPSAIAWARARYPTSTVNYLTADLLQAPAEWEHAFDFVLEIYTIQALPWDWQPQAMAAIARFLAFEGTLLAIARTCQDREHAEPPPWPVQPADLDVFTDAGLSLVTLEVYEDREDPPKPRLRALFTRRARQ